MVAPRKEGFRGRKDYRGSGWRMGNMKRGIHAVIGIDPQPRLNGIGNDGWQTPATSVF